MISPETAELLEDFEKRMRFINIVKYLRLHSFTDEVKEYFPNDRDAMDNLLLSVLLFIMDSTLRYGEKCTKNDIAGFLRELSEVYGYPAEKAAQLSEYIIIDILRNGGKIAKFATYISSEEKVLSDRPICRPTILNDDNGNFSVSDEVFEFLIRTKEIDSEIEFSVSRFKLNEFIKRGNYSKALRQSRELVNSVRNLKTRMDDFIIRCRTNIASVSVDEYEEIVDRVQSVFSDESKQLNDVRNVVSSQLQSIIDSVSTGKFVANADKTEREIDEILHNIDIVIDEQTRIFNKKFSLTDCYEQLLDEDLTYLISGRIDFEKAILEPIRKMSGDSILSLTRLLIPLYKPVMPRHFSIANFYANQKKITNEESHSLVDISNTEEVTENEENIRAERYIGIIRSLFEFISFHKKTLYSNYIHSLSSEQLCDYSIGNSLFDVMLKLYAMGDIDIAAWRESDRSYVIQTGEFDLSFCLNELDAELTKMSLISISRREETFEMTIDNSKLVTINDFDIEVIE